MPEEIVLDPRNILHFDSYDRRALADPPPQDDQLWQAIFKIQSELTPIEKTRDNTYTGSKYADLGDVWKVIHPLLLKYELLVTQAPGREMITKDVVIQTLIRHIPTGQWVQFFLTMPGGATSQSVGSAITYGCRYALVNFFRAIAVGDDDDGNASTQGQRRENRQQGQGKQQTGGRGSNPQGNKQGQAEGSERRSQTILQFTCDKARQEKIETVIKDAKAAGMNDADLKLCLPQGVPHKYKLDNAQAEKFVKDVAQAIYDLTEGRNQSE